MRFGAWIRAHRLRQNLSMDRVCQEVALSKAYLSLIETGQKGPPKDGIVRQIAQALKLDESDLLMRAHRERYPEDVLELRALIAQARQALNGLQSQKPSVAPNRGNGPSRRRSRRSSGPAQALHEALQGLERLVPPGSSGGDELTEQIEGLRAEEREFVLAMVQQIKRLRPRRGRQSKKSQ